MYGMNKEYGQPQEPPPVDQPVDPAADPAAAPADPQMEMEAQYQQMAESAPQPEKPFTVKAIKTLVKELNKTLSKLADEEIPEIQFEPGEVKGGKFDQPLPPDIFVTLLAMVQLIEMAGGGEFADKYNFDPYTAVSDTDLRKITAQLKRIGKDKKLIEAVKELAQGEEMAGDEGPEDVADEGDEMAPPPTEMTEEDEELASAMA
jgi:hypothetical protein